MNREIQSRFYRGRSGQSPAYWEGYYAGKDLDNSITNNPDKKVKITNNYDEKSQEYVDWFKGFNHN